MRRLIRYFKIWSQQAMQNAPASILLTVLVAESYKKLSVKYLEGDDFAVYNIAQVIYKRLRQDSVVCNPTKGSNENLNRLSKDEFHIFLEKLNTFIIKARKAIVSDNELDAVSIWTEVFGAFFPSASDTTITTVQSLVVYNFSPEVFVEVKNGKGERLVSGINSVAGVPPDCDIFFSIKNSQFIPEGAEIRWIVRNQGGEAECENDLGHFSTPLNSGFHVKESSMYAGNHSMDLEILSSSGQVFAFLNIPVKIIHGMKKPLRNSPRPYYARFPRKRK